MSCFHYIIPRDTAPRSSAPTGILNVVSHESVLSGAAHQFALRSRRMRRCQPRSGTLTWTARWRAPAQNRRASAQGACALAYIENCWRAYPSKAFKSNSACSAVMTPDSTIFRMRNCSSTVDCGGAGGRIDAGACGAAGRAGDAGRAGRACLAPGLVSTMMPAAASDVVTCWRMRSPRLRRSSGVAGVAHVRSHAWAGCPGLRDAHISAADHVHAARSLPDGGGESRCAVRRRRELHIRPNAAVGADGQASVGVSRQGQADIAVCGQRVVCLWAEGALHHRIALHLGRREPAGGGDDAQIAV